MVTKKRTQEAAGGHGCPRPPDLRMSLVTICPPEGSVIAIARHDSVLQGFSPHVRIHLPFGLSHGLTAQFASLSLQLLDSVLATTDIARRQSHRIGSLSHF